MQNGVTITSLDIENVKRVKAVKLTPTETGLTLIGGDNGQGKTSVLDAIMGALGGDTYKQSVHDGAERGTVQVELSNGVSVKRVYTAAGGSRLEVTDSTGKRGGQTLLQAFVSPFALDITTFMDATDKKKAEILLQVIGVNPQPFEERIKTLENDRLLKGREQNRAKGHAESLPYWEDAGDEKLDGNAISSQMTEALSHNARVRQAATDVDAAKDRVELAEIRVKEAEKALADAKEKHEAAKRAYADSQEKAASAGQPVDTQAISAKLQQVTEHNERVSQNLARKAAQDAYEALADEYRELTREIEQTREELRALLEGAPLPYPGLSVEGGVLTYNGRPWSQLSESEKLILATAVSRAVLPECGFVLIDGMERMDRKTLATFAAWLGTQGLQAIGTRVGDDGGNTIIIEDGMVAGAAVEEEPNFG
ncbi:MAG TPA: AAA family ATPase [Kiritimatiellia bacterium]|nr:AAA family ATPase [Kiritimatiellia bacterium]